MCGRDWLDQLEGLPPERRAVVERIVGEICRATSRDLAAWKAARVEAPEVVGFGMEKTPSGPQVEDFRAHMVALLGRLVAEDSEAAEQAFRTFAAIQEEGLGRGAGT